MNQSVASNPSGTREAVNGRERVRSHSSRRARARRARQRRKFAALAACALFAVGAPLGLLSMLDPGAPSGPLLLAAKSLSDVMEDRSPGHRTEAQLTKTKGKQRALAKVEEPPPEELVSALAGAPVLPEITEEPPVLAKLEPLDVPFPPGVFVIPPEDNDEPGNPIAVPEPGTWASMLMGFGAIGMAIRFRRRQRIATPLQVA